MTSFINQKSSALGLVPDHPLSQDWEGVLQVATFTASTTYEYQTFAVKTYWSTFRAPRVFRSDHQFRGLWPLRDPSRIRFLLGGFDLNLTKT